MRLDFYQKFSLPFIMFCILAISIILFKKLNKDYIYTKPIENESDNRLMDKFVTENNAEINIEKRNKEMRLMFQNETESMRLVCSRYPSYKNPPLQDNLMSFSVNAKHKLLMCRTGKHGSTTWAQNFVWMYNRHDSGGGQPQLKLRKMEVVAGIDKAKKRRIVGAINMDTAISGDTGIGEEDRGYLAFFVCRNPVEKLQSVFKYVRDMKKRVRKFRARLPLNFSKSLVNWDSFLDFVSNIKNYQKLGILTPLTLGCNPCKYKYDAVIKMETFIQDSGKILDSSGLSWLVTGHKNNHGSHSLQQEQLVKLFHKISQQSLDKFLVKYGPDFTLCGYHETLNRIKLIKDMK